ncbi:MAG: dihydroorotate dehydrogenase [Candidatus Sumerlaeia bacterium]|nr:dihydroorotate dehydrogenase [Candidatus Sumerlaeia bacterium]
MNNKKIEGIDLRVKIGNLILKNPVTVASGTFGFGREYGDFYEVNQLGAIFLKGLTLEEREGNPPPRIAEVPAGMINCIGLQNPGLEKFLVEVAPGLQQIDTVFIANIAGRTIQEYMQIASRLADEKAVSAIELNVSCPNVNEGGIEFGKSEKTLAELTRSVVEISAPLPVIVKLTPQISDIKLMAKIAEDSGASAISLINTVPAMMVDWRKERCPNGHLLGGLSGPAIKPIALRLVWEVAQAVSIPIIGMGGIMNVEDALEFFYAGADIICLGTANFVNPTTAIEILIGLSEFLQKRGLRNLTELKHYLRMYTS